MGGLLANYLREPQLPAQALRHIPGSDGWPLLGQTAEFLADPIACCRRLHGAYGAVSRGSMLFERRVNLMSAEANEFVLLDRDRLFSTRRGWEPGIGQLLRRGLLLRDGDDHRYHRRLMQPAFRKEALAMYLGRSASRIASAVSEWREAGGVHFHSAISLLTLEIAVDTFLGVDLQAEVAQVRHDYDAMFIATKAMNRLPVVGRAYARGLAARIRLEQFLTARIALRRASPGTDLFSQLCIAEDESGQRFADSEIVDHLILMLTAAHETTAYSLCTIAHALILHPEWQERVRTAVCAVGKPAPAYEDLAQLEVIDWVLREALRLSPPLPLIQRKSERAFEFQGFHIPANTMVSLYPAFTQRMPQWWTDPDRFDPLRFSPERAEHRRHSFAWIPFGGGAHMCLGLHFAEMQVKAVLHALLLKGRLQAPSANRMPPPLSPFMRPRDGFPVAMAAV